MFAKISPPVAITVLSCLLLLHATHQALGAGLQRAIEKPDPQGLYQKGVEKLQANRVEEAAAIFEQVTKVAPQFNAAYNDLGICYARMGKSVLAQRAFLKAVQLNPQSWEAHNNLGTNYLALGKPKEAAEEFQKSIALDPKRPLSLLNLGRARLELKQAVPAIDVLLRARKLSPHDSEISLSLADAYFMAGEARNALAVVEQTRGAGGSNSDLQVALGDLFLKYQLPQEAETCFLRAVEIDPAAGEKILSLASRSLDEGNYHQTQEILLPLKEKMDRSAPYHDLLGLTYSGLGDAIPAIESLQRAVQLDPQNEDYCLDMGRVLGEFGALDAAVEFLQWAVSVHPKSARLYVGLALACLPDLGRIDVARTAAEKAISLEPTLETAYTTVALVYETEKDWQSLIASARQLQKLNPQNCWGWYYEALAQLSLPLDRASSQSQIASSLRRAIELNPTFPLAHFQLGSLFFQEGDYPAAIQELKQAVELEPAYLEAHFLLARAYGKVGDSQQSQEELEIHRKLIADEMSKPRPHLKVRISMPQ